MPINTTIARVASEWLNENMHRAYPFIDSAAPVIPTQLFVDMSFLADGLVDPEQVYISQIKKTTESVFLTFSGTHEDLTYTFEGDVEIPLTTEFGTPISIDLRTADGNRQLQGDIYIGRTQAAALLPAVLEIEAENSTVFPACVRMWRGGVTGIRIGSEVYSGVVELVAGDGIDIEVSTTAGATTITFSATEYTLPDSNTTYTTDAALLQAAIDSYGVPVRTVSGVSPDAGGNITIVGDDTKATYVTRVNDGVIQIIDGTDNEPCIDSNAVETLMSGIAALNARAAELADAISAVDNNNNMISAQLARIP